MRFTIGMGQAAQIITNFGGNMSIINELKYDEQGLIPAIIQDINTSDILMLGYMNKESLKLSLDSGKATFWSRSRKKLWTKGETSGNFLNIKDAYYDCDQDTLLFKCDPIGPTCHTGNKTCFYRKLDK